MERVNCVLSRKKQKRKQVEKMKKKKEYQQREEQKMARLRLDDLSTYGENCILQTCFVKRIGGNCKGGRGQGFYVGRQRSMREERWRRGKADTERWEYVRKGAVKTTRGESLLLSFSLYVVGMFFLSYLQFTTHFKQKKIPKMRKKREMGYTQGQKRRRDLFFVQASLGALTKVRD